MNHEPLSPRAKAGRRRAPPFVGSVFLALCGLFATSQALAAGADSSVQTLRRDHPVSGAHQVLLSGTVNGGQYVYFDAEGSYAPVDKAMLDVYITLDGVKISNDSAISWADSSMPMEHSFRAMDAHRIPPGQHTVELVADAQGQAIVRSGAQLAIMTNPAPSVQTQALNGDSDVMTFPTGSIVEKRDQLPSSRMMAASAKASPVVALAAGTSYYAGSKPLDYGDAMWMLTVNGKEASNNSAVYTENDICKCSETRAPLFLHGVFTGSPTIALVATAAPWGIAKQPPDGVKYKVESRAKLIVMSGMRLAGTGGVLDPRKASLDFNRYAYGCMGSASNWPGCPASGSDVVLSHQTLNIPAGHNGVVFLSSVMRSQGASGDPGGTVRIWLTVDGVRRGSTGVQGYLRTGVSARTLTAGFLATGPTALSPGAHVVEVHGSATGTFKHMAYTKELPLIWFD